MRTLLLLRGAMGSGKSTWVKENHLENYTLSEDDFRLKITNPVLNEAGEFRISQKFDTLAWNMLMQCLEERMKQGHFTVIDATHNNRELVRKYEELTAKYRYQIYIKQFDVPLEVCLERNNKLTGGEPEPLVFDFKREPDIREEYKSQGFDDYYRMCYYGVCSSYRQESPEIKYVRRQIKKLFKHLELGVEYQYELILTRDIPKEQYTRYFNDVEIKKQYYLGHHVYIFIAFNEQLIKENGKNTFDYWMKYRRLDRNLEIGFMVRHRLVTWMEQNRSIDIAGDRHEFKFELDFNDFDKTLYFNQDLNEVILKS